MKQIARTLAILVLIATQDSVGAEADSAGKYASYYAALKARDSDDCEGVIRNLNAFLLDYPHLREKHPDFYWGIKFAIDECVPYGSVSGLAPSTGIDPLPKLPALEE